MNTSEMNMKELTLDELEMADGGWSWKRAWQGSRTARDRRRRMRRDHRVFVCGPADRIFQPGHELYKYIRDRF